MAGWLRHVLLEIPNHKTFFQVFLAMSLRIKKKTPGFLQPCEMWSQGCDTFNSNFSQEQEQRDNRERGTLETEMA